MSNVSSNTNENKNKIIQIDEKIVQNHIDQMVRHTVEETLNALLDAEADRLCGAERYERSESRKDTRAGHYSRKLQTKTGTVDLNVPKLRTLPFETAIIERYRRRESSVEEALIEMYLAGVSVRRIEDITEALWGEKVSPSTISELNKKVYVKIEEWRNRPLTNAYPYVYLDGVYLKRSWGGEVRNVAVLIAVGVDQDGYRDVLGVCEGATEDKESWKEFLRHLKGRGMNGVRLFISDDCLGLTESLPEFYPDAKWQRCVVHWYRNVFTKMPLQKRGEAAAMLKAIHAQEDRITAMEKAEQVAVKLERMKLKEAADHVRATVMDTLTYFDFPGEHRRCVRTNNMMERVIKEIRRRTRVVGAFPDGRSALMLVSARLRHVSGKNWGVKRYLTMDRLSEHDTVMTAASAG
jgi:putative transposase